MNSRETLAHAAEWFGWQEESLSFGLRSAFDALRLYDYAQAHSNLPEMADEWMPSSLVAAVGYNPFEEASHEARTSGADVAAAAMLRAHALLDRVAFVAVEGDTAGPLADLNGVVGRLDAVAVAVAAPPRRHLPSVAR